MLKVAVGQLPVHVQVDGSANVPDGHVALHTPEEFLKVFATQVETQRLEISDGTFPPLQLCVHTIPVVSAYQEVGQTAMQYRELVSANPLTQVPTQLVVEF